MNFPVPKISFENVIPFSIEIVYVKLLRNISNSAQFLEDELSSLLRELS